ncbi:MAG TPA: nucleotidyltransferase family protein, partial [Thermoanaerobaculia bacterium]|nr:nucleotidyltransferase family protein [Thermoanaerobaculia bacterium]
MTAEAVLVLALAQGDAPRLRLVAPAVRDWTKVAILAAQHQVDALGFWMLRRGDLANAASPAVDLPRAVEERLCASFIYHSHGAGSLASEIGRIADHLRSRRVEAIFLKGPWIAFHAYPHPGARPVGDIDLCVREAHYAESLAALRAAGYEPSAALPATIEEALRRAHYRRQIRLSAGSGRPVEVHFRLQSFGVPNPDESWVWETSREVEIGRSKVRVPGPEAMLLSLLLHANQHRFAVLRLLHDIRWALERDGTLLDAGLFHAQARRLG